MADKELYVCSMAFADSWDSRAITAGMQDLASTLECRLVCTLACSIGLNAV